jgi:uncharacterized protein with HEPN domain
MPKRSDELLLGDILEAMNSIVEYVGEVEYSKFIEDK